MISIVLLLKIIGAIGLIASWVFMYRIVRGTQHQLESLRKHCDEHLSAMALSLAQADDDGADDSALAESRRRALEAERRFTEGITSILNFNQPTGLYAAGALTADVLSEGNVTTGRKGE